MAMYDNENTVEKSFDLNYLSEHLLQAQWAEFVELKKVITRLCKQQGAYNYTGYRYWQCEDTEAFVRRKRNLGHGG